MPSIWLISLLLMFNFMTSSFSSYKPLPLFDRYLYPIVLPSLVLMGVFLATLLAGDTDLRVGQERLFWAVVLIVGFCGVSAPAVGGCMRFRPEQVERNLAVRLGWGDVVYTDYRTAANLVFFRTGSFLPSTATTIAWEKVDQRTIQKGTYVFMNKNKTEFLTKSYKYESPEFVARPPSTWQRVWSQDNAELYFVGGK